MSSQCCASCQQMTSDLECSHLEVPAFPEACLSGTCLSGISQLLDSLLAIYCPIEEHLHASLANYRDLHQILQVGYLGREDTNADLEKPNFVVCNTISLSSIALGVSFSFNISGSCLGFTFANHSFTFCVVSLVSFWGVSSSLTWDVGSIFTLCSDLVSSQAFNNIVLLHLFL